MMGDRRWEIEERGAGSGVEIVPHAPSTSLSLRSSIGMSNPRFNFQSIVESGIAT